MEIKNGICNIGGSDFELRYTFKVALEMEKKFGGYMLSLMAVENVKGACDTFVIMLKEAVKRYNEEWGDNVSLSKNAIDEILFNYLENTESALNIIKEVKEVIKRDRKTEQSRIKSKKKNDNKYIRNDLQTMVVTGTSLLNFSYEDIMKMTIAEYSGYLNRYNEINYYDTDKMDDEEEDFEPDESYREVGSLEELLNE